MAMQRHSRFGHRRQLLELGRDENGKRLRDTSIFHGTKGKAEEEMIGLLRKIATGTYVANSRMTVAEYLRHWLSAYAKPSVGERSYERYEGIVNQHLEFHDLRHTHATLLLRQGTHPKVVSERLGHATVGITLDTYSHVLADMQDDAAQRLDGALAVAMGNARHGKS